MKDILLNLLFILVVLLITKLYLNIYGRHLGLLKQKLVIFISSLISIIFCMTFSITHEEFRYDLRVIPLVLGGLLGGKLVSVGLFISILGYRLFWGLDPGFWGNCLNYGLVLILLLLFSRRFEHATTKHKIFLFASIILIHILFSRFVYTYLFFSGTPLSLFIQVSLIKLISSSFICLSVSGMYWHHRLRDQLEEMEKIELVSYLSASISHEIRNGLTGAYGFLQLLKEQEIDPLKNKYLTFALEELKRTENIIRDFLTFAKPEPRQVKNITMDELINNSLALVEPLANMNSIEIQKNLKSFSIKGDESMLQQALINILKNAIEAMPNGGVLKIEMATAQETNIISIRDTGIGMTMEQLNRIGTPYYTTKGKNGTGLGMMVTYRIIQGLNGKIKVSSEVGKGTTFTINFPQPASLE